MIPNADILMLMFIPAMFILLCVSGAMLIEEYGALEKMTEATPSLRQDNNGDTVFWQES